MQSLGRRFEFSGGFLRVARIRGVPVRVHWSLPLGALVLTRFSFSAGNLLGLLVVVVAHELGHAVVARLFGVRVVAVRVHAFGGDCQLVEEDGTQEQRAAIAWGGIVAQALVGAVTLLLLVTVGEPDYEGYLAPVVGSLVKVNLWCGLLNLVPLPPLDGYLAWQLPQIWLKRREEDREELRREELRFSSARRRRLRLDEDDDDDDDDDHVRVPDEVVLPMPAEVEILLDRIVEEVRVEGGIKRARSGRE